MDTMSETTAVASTVVGDDGHDGVARERLHAADGVELFAVGLTGDRGWRPTREAPAYGYVLRGPVALRWESASRTVAGDEFFQVPAGAPPVVTAPTDQPATLLVAFDRTETDGAPPDRPRRAARSDVVASAGGQTVSARTAVPGHEPSAPAAGDSRARADAVCVAGRDSFASAGELSNVRRHTPFPDQPVRMVRGHSEGEIVSEWHHHADNHVFGFVLAGDGYVEWGRGEGERLFVEAGECFHVPAGFVHRDRSDSPDSQEFVLWLTGSDPRTVTDGVDCRD
ncbi:cupin domain-containing protein [Halobaculum sp. MBLA0143]|uniref:cupin domain-containing protein n=1 Tax=Halobaculum sp. MBLA0143 TaxID=3079933 RepID=UPI003525C425